MEKVLADAFLDFYQKVLKPEFDVLKGKQAEHDERFSEVLGHLDSIYNRLSKVEDGAGEMNASLKQIEEAAEAGRAMRSDLDRRVKEVKEQLSAVQDRLESVVRDLEK